MPKAIHNLWRPGKLNYTDYWTKHHPTKHHQNMRKEFITPQIVLELLRQEKKRSQPQQHEDIKNKRNREKSDGCNQIWIVQKQQTVSACCMVDTITRQ